MRNYKPEFGIRTSLNRCFLSTSSLFRHLKSRRSSATPATLNALRLEANKNQQFSFVLNPNSGYKKSKFILSKFTFLLLLLSNANAYPLDGGQMTGIQRLEGYLLSLQTPSGQKTIVHGSRLKQDSVILFMKNRPYTVPSVNQNFTDQIRRNLGAPAGQVSFSVLDISNPEQPVLAAHNAHRHFMPASVGKIIVALAWFQRLKELYPSDQLKRLEVLRQATIEADDLIFNDHHEVPFWDLNDRKIKNKLMTVGTKANVYTYLDWMISASANSAGTILMKELILLDKLGIKYQSASPIEKQSIWFKTSKAERTRRLNDIVSRSLIINGLKTSLLFQVSPFTKTGKAQIPARGSTATTQELLQFLTQIERGLLVDSFSSMEIKKLLYSTQLRARLASSPALDRAAVYYKSGSNYKCNYNCGENEGDVENIMNSIAIVEYPIEDPKIIYLLAIHSNVPRVNAVDLHRQFGTAIQNVMLNRHK
jgi:hypothetical protein